MKRNLLTVFFLLCMASSLAACATPIKYSAESIDVRLVDADTKQPIEGAVIVAHWVLEGGIHTDRIGELIILETVSDRHGNFHFDAWGPITHWGRGSLTFMDPQLIIFKSGYDYQVLNNPLTKEAIEGHPIPVRRSQWNGKTIQLSPFKESLEKYARRLSFLMTALRFVEDDCSWKKTPRMILALQQQSELLRASGIVTAIYSVDYLPTDKAKCGAPKEFFRSYSR